MFGVKLLVTVFHLGMRDLGWKNLVPYKNEDFWFFFLIHFFTVKWVIFQIFGNFSIKHSVCVSVCVSVCEWATGHTFWPRNIIFGLSDTWPLKWVIFQIFWQFFIKTLVILEISMACDLSWNPNAYLIFIFNLKYILYNLSWIIRKVHHQWALKEL